MPILPYYTQLDMKRALEWKSNLFEAKDWRENNSILFRIFFQEGTIIPPYTKKCIHFIDTVSPPEGYYMEIVVSPEYYRRGLKMEGNIFVPVNLSFVAHNPLGEDIIIYPYDSVGYVYLRRLCHLSCSNLDKTYTAL